MRSIVLRIIAVLFFAYMAAFFSVIIAILVHRPYGRTMAANIVLRTVFLVGGILCIAASALAVRTGSIKGGGDPPRTYRRADRPVEFWALTLSCLIVGAFFFVFGIVELVGLAVHGPW
jgi:hypothetical protein